MNNNKKIIEYIYDITLGNFGVDKFNSLKRSEKSLFIKIIFKSRAHFLIYKLLKKYEEEYQEYDYYKKAKDKVNFYTYHSMIHIEESYRLNTILYDNKIKFVFLKGMHLINSYYDDLIERPVRDIDILIQKKDLKKVVRILLECGYRFEYDVDESSLNSFLINSYDIPILIGKNGSRIEVHFSIENSSKSKECVFSKRFLDDSKNIKLGRNLTSVLSTEDLILHLIYHGLKKQGPDVGIIFVYDIYKVLSSNKYNDALLLEKASLYKLTPHLKMIVRLLTGKTKEKRLHDLDKKISFNVNSETISSLEFLLIRNDIYQEEIRFFKLIEKIRFKKLINNYNQFSLRRQFKINKNENLKIIFSYFYRIFMHIKIIFLLIFRLVFFRSIRLQFFKIKNILRYINDF